MSTLFNSVIAMIGALTGILFGEWDMILNMLCVVVLLDIVSGIIAGIVNRELSSKVGGRGIVKKLLIFIVVAVAHQLDLLTGGAAMLRNAAIAFYLWNEMLSIVENIGEAGLPVPEAIRRTVETLRDKDKNKNGNDDSERDGGKDESKPNE